LSIGGAGKISAIVVTALLHRAFLLLFAPYFVRWLRRGSPRNPYLCVAANVMSFKTMAVIHRGMLCCCQLATTEILAKVST
jgi:hypothetical protein